jgi:hypothetical protein
MLSAFVLSASILRTCTGLYSKPQCFDYAHARKEFETTCFSAIRDLLNKTGVQPRQIGIVITNSSLFNPTPSLAATIMNHFKMPPSTFGYNLGGMGCSAGGCRPHGCCRWLVPAGNWHAQHAACAVHGAAVVELSWEAALLLPA